MLFRSNRSLFEQYGIPLPTDSESFAAACQAFETVGIRGFTADYAYDYTCMETLQGLSAAELTTTAGRISTATGKGYEPCWNRRKRKRRTCARRSRCWA